MSKADEIKIIDLLNNIANGEKVPKHIKVDGINYIFDEFEMFYHRDNDSKEDLLVLGKDYNTWDFLNWNVEVIEDQTIDIESIKEINTSGCLVDTSTLKINQLIQA